MGKTFNIIAGAVALSVLFPTAALAKEVVNPLQTYKYTTLQHDLQALEAAYPELIEVKSIGKTAYGRDILAVKLGKGQPSLLVNGSHHAREWLSTNLNMYMIDRYADAYEKGLSWNGFPVRDLLDQGAIWFVPMVNPDGVTLQQEGLAAFPAEAQAKLLSYNGGSRDFKRWKANGQGIDPNLQYPAGWDRITHNVYAPSWQNYKGKAPGTAEEAQAMMKFTAEIRPEAAVSYHSSGRILYWNFDTKAANVNRDYRIASTVSAYTGYSLVPVRKNPPGGGYTDWFISTYARPALTPELSYYVGDTNPPLSVFEDEWKRNQKVPLYMLQEGLKLWNDRTPSVAPRQYFLKNLAKTALYTSPVPTAKTTGAINPQTVKVTAQKGGWLCIETWAGPRWIYPSASEWGLPQVTKQIRLTADTPLYGAPLEQKKLKASLSPQTVTSFESHGEWHHIHTWMGELWIKAK